MHLIDWWRCIFSYLGQIPSQTYHLCRLFTDCQLDWNNVNADAHLTHINDSGGWECKWWLARREKREGILQHVPDVITADMLTSDESTEEQLNYYFYVNCRGHGNFIWDNATASFKSGRIITRWFKQSMLKQYYDEDPDTLRFEQMEDFLCETFRETYNYQMTVHNQPKFGNIQIKTAIRRSFLNNDKKAGDIIVKGLQKYERFVIMMFTGRCPPCMR